MPASRSAKKATTRGGRGRPTAATTAARAVREKAAKEAAAAWIATHDTLLDQAEQHPITVDELLTEKLMHASFTQPGVGEQRYDWSAFRAALEARSAESPRWFMQLREEDLLLDPDGLEGVTVDCFVIAEAHAPTLAPAEYIVKVHWPYSDAEDNTPERILPISGQNMCWRRVVRGDGADLNAYLLQRRHEGLPTGTGSAGLQTAAPKSASAFGFGAAPSAAPASTTTTASSFGFGAAPVSSSTTTTASVFGFGAASHSANPPQNTTTANNNSAHVAQPAASFGFGVTCPAPSSTSTTAAVTSATAPLQRAQDGAEGAVTVQPLKPSEVLFTLWSRKRLQEMAKAIKSGSRIVREGFVLHGSKSEGGVEDGAQAKAAAVQRTIKLVMQNDRKDSVEETVRQLLLGRVFAKEEAKVRAVDEWVDRCPVYDATLAAALQKFRERFLRETADDSDAFHDLYARHHEELEAELRRIVAIRATAAQVELDRIDAILRRLDEHKLAEKSTFRLLKYYAKNDVQRFRPFGKISGISEMGEMVDVCVPPAHVNVNPFLVKPAA